MGKGRKEDELYGAIQPVEKLFTFSLFCGLKTDVIKWGKIWRVMK